MSALEDRRELLERLGRFYGEEHFALAFTAGTVGNDAKRVTTKGWDQTKPLATGDYGAGLLKERGLQRNVAVVLRPSNLVVLECDSEIDLVAIEELFLPTTLTVRSSEPYKRHFYFRPPEALEALPYVAFRFESGRVTADSGRYFLAPPSLHPSGVQYSFLPGLGPGDTDIVELPEQIYRELVERSRTESNEQRERIAIDPEAKISAGQRRETLFRFACMLRRWGRPYESILAECLQFNAERCDPPVSPELVEVQVRGAMKKQGDQELVGAAESPRNPQPDRLLRGGAFILDLPTDVPAVWRGAAGLGTAWAVGEGLMIVGPDGVGKTTLIQQVSLGRIGLRERVLGMQLTDDDKPLLYFALDRPAQIARSFARMVSEEDREVLDRRLIIWKGPPPFDIVKDPQALADFTEEQGAGTVVIDSLKDLAAKLSDDEVGGKVNTAFQHVLERGIDLLCGHHQRKAQAGASAPKKLADVFGSRWLTAGMGSVFMLWGEAGDLEIECLHLKQPDEELGPWKLLHDHIAGKTVIVDQVDLLELVAVRGSDGLTAEQGAALLFDSATPARNEIEKARRRLEKLTDQGFLTRTGERPDPVIYRRMLP